MIAQRTFRSAVEALRRGNRSGGYSLLRQVLIDNPGDALAWLWMSGLVDDARQQRECFEQVLLLDPGCTLAQEGLRLLRLREVLASTPAPPPRHSSPALRGLSAYLISQHFVTREALEQALAAYHPPQGSAEEPPPLGDILVGRGGLTPSALATTLMLLPADQPAPAPTPAPTRRSADVLAVDRRITPEQLGMVLDGQAHLYKAGTLLMLGEMLLRGGFATHTAMIAALDRQHEELMRRLGSLSLPE